MKKYLKRKIFLSIFLLGMIVFGRSLIKSRAVSAEEDAADVIKSALRKEGIDLISVERSENIIVAELRSNGDGRCTVADIKAIRALNDAIYAETGFDEIDGIQIDIYDIHNENIYNSYVAKKQNAGERMCAASKQDAELSQDRVNEDVELVQNRAEEAVRVVLEEYPCRIVKMICSKAYDGNLKMEIDVEASQSDAAAFTEISALSAELELKLAVQGVSQCIVNVMDAEKDEVCLLYVSCDFVRCEYMAWVSPEMQDVFVQTEGPQKVD